MASTNTPMSDRRPSHDASLDRPVSPLSGGQKSTDPAQQTPATVQHQVAKDNGAVIDGALPQQGQETVITLQPGQQVQQLQVIPASTPSAADAAVVISANSVDSRHDSTAVSGQDSPVFAAGDSEKNDNGPSSEPRSFLQVVRAWTGELIALLLAILMIVAEVVILSRYNNNSIDYWVYDWQINSVFGFLTAILEAAVAYAIGTCLGQLRWLWYHGEAAELRWMDKLTNARTPSGAAGFILTSGAWKHWAGVGAFLVVALLGVGVFTQNVIVVKNEHNVFNETFWNGSVPVTNTFFYDYQYGDAAGDYLPLVPMVTAINAGFAYPASVNSEQADVSDLMSCDLGNCTFGLYSSLAVCSVCADISHQVVLPDCTSDTCTANNSQISLQDGSLTLNGMLGSVNMTADDEYPTNGNLTNIGPLIAHYKGIGSWQFPEVAPNATECAIYWCVQTYNGTTTNNNFDETSFSNWTNTTAEARTTGNIDLDTYEDITLKPPVCYSNNDMTNSTNGTAYDTACLYQADGGTHRALQNYFIGHANQTGFLTGAVTSMADDPTGLNKSVSSFAANAIASGCAATDASSTCDPQYNSIFEDAISNMTLYMTANLRTVNEHDNGPGYSYAPMYDDYPYFHVRWGWLAYPIVIVATTLVFLAVTMWKSRRHDPWKSSVVALILHGMSDDERGDYHQLGLDHAKRMKEVAETWTVSLNNVDGTYAFRRDSVRPGKATLNKMKSAGDLAGHGSAYGAKAALEAYGNSS